MSNYSFRVASPTLQTLMFILQLIQYIFRALYFSFYSSSNCNLFTIFLLTNECQHEQNINKRSSVIQVMADYWNYMTWCHGRSLGSPPEVAKHIHTTWTLFWTPFPTMLIDLHPRLFSITWTLFKPSILGSVLLDLSANSTKCVPCFYVASPALCSWPLPVVFDCLLHPLTCLPISWISHLDTVLLVYDLCLFHYSLY